MSRTLSISLITFGITVLSILVCLHFYLMEQQHDSLFTYTHTVNKRLIEQKKRNIYQLHATAQEFLQDPIYTRRRGVLTIFTEADIRLESYFKALEEFDNKNATEAPDFHFLAHNALSPVLDSAVQVFQRDHLKLDLNERDMNDLIKDFEAIRHGVVSRSSNQSFQSPAFQLERETITLELLADMHDLLLRVASLSCYRGCFYGINSHFPFLMNSYTDIKSGKIINTQIGVGTFDTYLGSEYSVIVVDGDTLTVCEDGLADFSFKSGAPGRYSKKLEVIITNPLTGEVRKGESTYNYQVY